jgi:hypothetical protein
MQRIEEKGITVLDGKQEGKRQLGKTDIDWKIILNRILKIKSVSVWTKIIWLNTGSSGGILWTR